MTAPEKPNAALGRLLVLLAPTFALARLVNASKAFLRTWRDPAASPHQLAKAHSVFSAALAEAESTMAEVGEHATDNEEEA